MPCCARVHHILQKKWALLIGWQICAVILCGAGSLCAGIIKYAGSSLNSFMIACGYTLCLVVSMWKVPKTKVSWWPYILAGWTAVAGDSCAVLSLNMTSLATALLLTTTTVFWCVPLGWIMFRRRITLLQGLAILLAIGGGAVLIVADGTGGDRWIGDVLSLVAAVCYAVNATAQEYLSRKGPLHTYYFRFGASAAPVAWILAGSTEWKKIRDYNWSWQIGTMYGAYAICLASFNIIVPFFMQFSDATTCGISMLTANFYSLGISILVFGQKANWLYLVGFFCIPVAIAIFSIFTPKEAEELPVNSQDPLLFDPDTQQSLLSDQLTSGFTDSEAR